MKRRVTVEAIKRILGNAPVFVCAYIVFMIPTYLLPYVGSNSAIVGATGAAAGAGMSPAFWVHLLALAVLCLLCFFRGGYVGKGWLLVFPILAAAFDMIPGLSVIPLVPTVLHLLAIILGVAASKPASMAV